MALAALGITILGRLFLTYRFVGTSAPPMMDKDHKKEIELTIRFATRLLQRHTYGRNDALVGEISRVWPDDTLHR